MGISEEMVSKKKTLLSSERPSGEVGLSEDCVSSSFSIFDLQYQRFVPMSIFSKYYLYHLSLIYLKKTI